MLANLIKRSIFRRIQCSLHHIFARGARKLVSWAMPAIALICMMGVGTAAYAQTPTLEVQNQGTGVVIAHGDTTPSTSDGTDFGSAVGQTLKTKLVNVGTADLTTSTVTITGADAAHFSIHSTYNGAGLTILPNRAGDLWIRFTPTSVGQKTAVVEIASNDPVNDPYTFTITGLRLDTVAPTATSIVRQTPVAQLTNADSLVFRLTFDEGVQNVDAADFAVSGTSATVTAVAAVSADVYDVTVSGGDLAGYNGTVGLAFSSAQNIRDLANNPFAGGAPSTNDAYTLDNVRATVAISGVPAISFAPYTATFTFSEAVTGFVVGDISLTNATASAFTGSGTTYTALITPTADGAVTVDVAAGVAQDSAGNGNTAATQATSTYSNAPSLEVQNSGTGVVIAHGSTTPSTSEGTDFGSANVGSQGALLKTKLVNVGATNLTTSTVTITGADAAHFTIHSTYNGAGLTILPNRGGDLWIRFTPSSVGQKTAVVEIASNDPVNPTYTFTITGLATVESQIQVKSSSFSSAIVMPNGAAASTIYGTDYGLEAVNGGGIGYYFGVKNLISASADLVVSDAVLGGADAGQFSIDTNLGNNVSIIPGSDKRITIFYSPTAVGSHTATVTIPTNDPDDNPFVFNIKGEGGHSEIDISSSVNGAIADGGTDALGTIAAGVVQQITYTIENKGAAPLGIKNFQPTVTGSVNVTNLVANNYGNLRIASNSSTTFPVSFRATQAGPFSIDLEVLSDDADETPYNITISGTATGAPEIHVKRGITNTPSGVTINHGRLAGATGGITVVNEGTADLTLGPAVITNATHLVDVSIVGDFTSARTLSAGTSLTNNGYVISPAIRDGDATNRSFTISIPNNDADENPYLIPMTYTAAFYGTVAQIQSISRVGASPTNADTLYWDVQFDESGMQNIDASDFSVAGTTAALSVDSQADNATGTLVRLKLTGGDLAGLNGSVTLSVASGNDILDSDNNILNNLTPVGTDETVTVLDNTAPTVTLGALTAVGNGTYTSAITLSEAAGNSTVFDQSDLALTNATASLSGSGTSFTATLTPAADGTVGLAVNAAAFQDAAGNDSTAAAQITINHDGTAPTVTLGALTAVGNGTYTSAITLSEAAGNSTVFDQSDLVLTNATASLSGSGTSFTATLTPAADGTVGLAVNAAAFQDAAGNDSTAAAQITINHDAPPSVVISGAPAHYIGTTSFAVTVTFSETVIGFATSDISVTNASVSGVTGSGSVYQATIVPAGSGNITISIAVGVAQGVTLQGNTASNIVTVKSLSVVSETQKQISQFITSRMNSLAQNQPVLTCLIAGGCAGRSFNLNVENDQQSFSYVSRPDRPVWMRLKGSRAESGNTENDYLFGALGSHRRVSDGMIVGLMFQFDHHRSSEGVADTEGNGWMMGHYVAGEITDQPLYYEASVLWGQTQNKIKPVGTYQDSFQSDRMLLQGRVEGRIEQDALTLKPNMRASFAMDKQRAYTDSLGNAIAAQSLEQGQISLGFDFNRPVSLGPSVWILDGGISGIYSKTKGGGAAGSIVAPHDGGRARVFLTASHELANGGDITIGVDYDGIGADSYESYGFDLGYKYEF